MEFARELTSFFTWYDEHRPHATLEGKTPTEVYIRLRPATRRPTSGASTRQWSNPRAQASRAPDANIRARRSADLRRLAFIGPWAEPKRWGERALKRASVGRVEKRCSSVANARGKMDTYGRSWINDGFRCVGRIAESGRSPSQAPGRPSAGRDRLQARETKMSLLSRLLGRRRREKAQLCHWMLKRISEGIMPDQQELVAHVKQCPVCGPAIEHQAQQGREATQAGSMKRKTAQFADAVHDLGGVLDVSTLPHEMASMFYNIDTRNGFIIEGINERPVYTDPCGDIFVGHVYNSDLNAVAFEHRGQESVGLYAGLSLTINALTFGLFGCPEFLRRTFPTRTERFSVKDVREAVRVIVDPYRVPKTTIGQPQSYERAVASAYVTGLCQTLASFHEIGHIVGGHLMHLSARGTSGTIRRFEHSERPESGRIGEDLSQALEFDADAYSVGLILGVALKSTWVFFQFAELSQETIAKYCCLAVNLIFHILDVFSVNGQLKTSSTHPAPGVRLALAYVVICAYLEREAPDLVECVPELFAKCYGDVAEFWCSIGFPRRTVERDFGALYEVGREIEAKQKQLRKEILKELCQKRREKLEASPGKRE